MSQLDLFLPLLATSDTKKKLSISNDIINYLDQPGNSIECEDIGGFIDGIIPWMNQSNFRVSQNGLEIMGLLVKRMKADFRPYVNAVLPDAVDRLGDSKESVRDKAHILLIMLMLHTMSPQLMFEKLTPAFSHKLAKVREEVMVLLQNALADHGAHAIQLSRLLPSVVKLLSDPAAPVRDTAFNTLVEVYKHVGERVRLDLQKKFSVPPAKLGPLMATFDQVKESGQMMPTATLTLGPAADSSKRDDEDEVDRMAVKSAASRSTSAPPVRRVPPQKAAGANGTLPSGATTPGLRPRAARPRSPSIDRRTPDAARVRRVPSLVSRKPSATSSASSTAAGAIDEAMFISAFEDVPKVTLYSHKDLEDHMVKIRETVSQPSNPWDKRIEALKKLRSILIAGGTNYDELYQHLRLMEPALQLTVQDLRSQVVREGCITIAYLSQQLGHRVDHVCLSLLPYLIELIPNSAKVMSTSGVVAIRFIIQNTHYARLIPIITGQLSSKSREIRRACCEFLEQLLTSWPTQALERHVAVIQEAVRKGVSDADSEARAVSRRAYWGFADHFKEQADSLLNSLDSQHKKLLAGEMSKSSSNNSLTGPSAIRVSHAAPVSSRSRASSRAGSQENLSSRTTSLPRRSHIPQPSPPKPDRGGGESATAGQSPASYRSTSAIDLQAAQRARARAQYAAAQRMRVGSGVSLPRPRKLTAASPARGPPPAAAGSTESPRTPRNRGRRVTQSQPGSRSGSPSSRLSYATYTSAAAGSPGDAHTAGRTRRRSGIPRSTGTSREPSPHRLPAVGAAGSAGSARSRSIAGGTEAVHGRPVTVHKILQQSREAESALADALATTRTPRPFRSFDDHSDESETSSVCSERSYESANRREYASGWHGGPPSLSSGRLRDVWEDSGQQDVGEVIASLAATQWADRKDGLLALQAVLRSNRMLTASELKRITEIFTKMFMDTHTKVFSIFLDALQELVVQHHDDLGDWLYVLVTRLLNKLGADLLGSVVQKINKTLDIVRASFPHEQQLHCVFRFLLDQTQTPNTKVKVNTLRYLRAVLDSMDAASFPADDPDLPLAVTKVIGWTTDQKSVDIRNSAKGVVVALFNLNTPHFTRVLSQLSKLYQDTASEVMQQHLRRRASIDQSAALMRARSPGSPMAPSNGGPAGTFPRAGGPRSLTRLRSDPDDTENLNPEEFYSDGTHCEGGSLRRTTAEIQNYSFDGRDTGPKAEPERDSTSQDSGISQMSLALERTELSSAERTESRSPARLRALGEPAAAPPPAADEPAEPLADEAELVMTVLAELNASHGDRNTPERRNALLAVCRLAKQGSAQLWSEHFRTLLRLLLDNLRDGSGPVRELVLAALTEMLRRDCITPLFHPFIELIFLRVLDAHREPSERDVVRAAEQCAAVLAGRLPAESVVRVLNPLIQTGEYPVNQAAIKTLTRLMEQHSRHLVISCLPEIMPSLLKAYDNTESSVRKAAVFCMVTIHTLCGEEAMQPHLATLNATKLKLLNLYIKRAQTQSNPGTPRTNPGSPK
ncbi:CLIP-associating protein 1-like isoform X4 [Amphibalanus amphitrite]|uniref:CLIP-associating protein 1-like isoform X4 n=1 Tax=Amphibalanus amphitrite TaxID=1232801 RepID=UPI001C925C29|nr:CLIP-associating protein 1-like isoform X4 [Amphibalanus amphitrite]